MMYERKAQFPSTALQKFRDKLFERMEKSRAASAFPNSTGNYRGKRQEKPAPIAMSTCDRFYRLAALYPTIYETYAQKRAKTIARQQELAKPAAQCFSPSVNYIHRVLSRAKRFLNGSSVDSSTCSSARG